MKIKTLKIKVENENYEYPLPDFYTLANIIYSIRADLIRENDEYYWMIMIVFEPKVDILQGSSKPLYNRLPIGFKEAIDDYILNYNLTNLRVKNCINLYLEDLIEFKQINDFKKIKGLGNKSLFVEYNFLSGLLEIIKGFQTLQNC